MSTDLRLNREQCEKAFAAYLTAKKVELGNLCPLVEPVDVGVYIRKGQFNEAGEYLLDNPEEIPLPFIGLACPVAKPHEGMAYPICEMHFILMTSADEESAAARASARFGFLTELFDESHQAALFAALNAPATGPDERAVKDFHIFGYYQTEDMGQETDRRWIDHLVFEAHCTPSAEF